MRALLTGQRPPVRHANQRGDVAVVSVSRPLVRRRQSTGLWVVEQRVVTTDGVSWARSKGYQTEREAKDVALWWALFPPSPATRAAVRP